jgi:hypothetical protein
VHHDYHYRSRDIRRTANTTMPTAIAPSSPHSTFTTLPNDSLSLSLASAASPLPGGTRSAGGRGRVTTVLLAMCRMPVVLPAHAEDTQTPQATHDAHHQRRERHTMLSRPHHAPSVTCVRKPHLLMASLYVSGVPDLVLHCALVVRDTM